ncbi:MFS transporter (plasmid) [Ensifer adhaerens]|uniref:MFS transporter n=1 Tax=Ensifer adhaerens TaxID=106592 RepID=UPI0023A96A2C|nr:MFS transporter [Ensifer adhaerens]WDZ81837.1 MFS transporter [Ensifer adhaerens]
MSASRFSLRALATSRRVRCALFFLAGGVGIGAWAASLPLLSAKLNIDKGQLGALLLCFALGAIALMVNIGRVSDRLGSSHLLSLGGSLVFGVSIFATPFVDGLLTVGALIVVAGTGFGTLDVSMNIEASDIERASGRHLMSSFHAMFSIGNIVGAFLVGVVLSFGGQIHACLGGAGVLVVITALTSRIIDHETDEIAIPPAKGTISAANPSLSRQQRVLVLTFGAIGFLAFLAEGGIIDWSAVYMVGTLGASESVGAYAFAAFSVSMALGRLLGDIVTQRVGHVNMLRFGGIVCGLSVLAMLVAHNVVVGMVALAICGFGVANMIPAVFASAGKVGSHAAGRAMSIVTTLGYSGLLIGPALLGFIAQIPSLTISLALVALSFGVISLGTVYLKRLAAKFQPEMRGSKHYA